MSQWEERFTSEIERRIDRSFVGKTGLWPADRERRFVMCCLINDLGELGDKPLVPMEELQGWIDGAVDGLLGMKRQFRGWKP